MNIIKIALISATIALTGAAVQATTVDTIQAPTGFFTPSLGQELQFPYYRGKGQDWGWQHNPIAAGFTSALLNVSAYDVDAAQGEVDKIEAYDSANSTWVLLGSLAGANNIFSFTEFDIFAAAGGNLIDDIIAGLQVRIKIDTATSGSWLVSLGKSVITTDGGNPGNPNPGTVPLPAAGWLMMAGLGGLAAMRRRRKAA